MMLEIRRIFRYTYARIVLMMIVAIGLLLYASVQLNGMPAAEFLTQNQTYHNLCLKENETPSGYESISKQRQEKSIRTALSDPDSLMYDVYFDLYPEYRPERTSPEELQARINDEAVYIFMEQQAAYQQSFRERIQHMEEDYQQKSGSRLFRNRQEIIKQMEITLLDYQRQASAELSYGDDRFILSVLQNKYNAALLLILVVFGCFQLSIQRESTIHAVTASAKQGRRWLMRSQMAGLYTWTAVSVVAILIPQFIFSYFLYDGIHQWDRFIQSVQYFSDFVIPCRSSLFILLYIGYATVLACFVSTLIYTIFNLADNKGMALVILAILIWLSYIGYNIAGNDKNFIFKYCNIISLLVPAELLRIYRIIVFQGLAVNISVLVLIVFILLAGGMAWMLLIRAAKPYPHEGEGFASRTAGCFLQNTKKGKAHILPWEHAKMFSEGRTLICFVAALFFAIGFQMPALNLDSVSMIKQVYYQQAETMEFEDICALLPERLADTETVIEEKTAVISAQGLSAIRSEELRLLYSQKSALESILAETDAIIQHNQSFQNKQELIDPYPAQALLESSVVTQEGKWRTLALLLLVIFISSVSIPLENKSKTFPVLAASRKGIIRILKRKIFTVWTEMGIIILCFAIPEAIKLLETTPIHTAVQSIPCLRDCRYDISVGAYWLMLWGLRLAFLMGLSSLIITVSFAMKTMLGGIAVGEGFFGMINLLPVLFPSLNIPFLPVTLICSYNIVSSGIVAAGVLGILLCIMLLLLLQKPFIYRLIRL